ncbi:hypothetical protein KKF61_07755 [Patescibacteria group bacterium]|nr:hypothetical protein [Patescibacteria group bacterium]
MAITGITRNFHSASVQFGAAASLSGSMAHAGRPIIGMIAPQSWTAACLLFEVAACTGGTFHKLYSDNGNFLVQMNFSASRAYAASSVLDKLAPFAAFRLVSGSVNSGTLQGIQQASARSFVFFTEG